MSNLISKNVIVDGTIGASETDTVISSVFEISGLDSTDIVIDLIYDDAVAFTAITAKLQSSPDQVNWIDSKTVSITAATATTTLKSIELLVARAADQEFLPLRKFCRVVITSGTGDSVLVDKCYIGSKLFSN